MFPSAMLRMLCKPRTTALLSSFLSKGTKATFDRIVIFKFSKNYPGFEEPRFVLPTSPYFRSPKTLMNLYNNENKIKNIMLSETFE
jgi:hypothetical protein